MFAMDGQCEDSMGCDHGVSTSHGSQRLPMVDAGRMDTVQSKGAAFSRKVERNYREKWAGFDVYCVFFCHAWVSRFFVQNKKIKTQRAHTKWRRHECHLTSAERSRQRCTAAFHPFLLCSAFPNLLFPSSSFPWSIIPKRINLKHTVEKTQKNDKIRK
jgi:hypothetical protein